MSNVYLSAAFTFSIVGLLTGDTNNYILAAGLFIASEITDLNK